MENLQTSIYDVFFKRSEWKHRMFPLFQEKIKFSFNYTILVEQQHPLGRPRDLAVKVRFTERAALVGDVEFAQFRIDQGK